MSRRLRQLVAVGVLVLALVAGAVVAPSAGADAGAESDFVARINAARSGRGLAPLQVDGELTGIARRWSQRMADEQRLSHNPNLSREVTQNWEKLAENVGFGPDPGTIHDAFMNSSAHRANILDGALTHVGVGVVVDGAGQLWVTEVFMRLRGGSAPAPTTTAAPPTTARPRPAPTTAPPPPPPPPPTTTPPAPEVPAEPAPTPDESVEAASAPAAPAGPSPRLVLVLDRLADLDREHGA